MKKKAQILMDRVFLLLCFVTCSFLLQAQPIKALSPMLEKNEILADEFMYENARSNVSDYLYFDDESGHYLMSKSPLSFFSWKEKAFDAFPEIQMVEYKSEYGRMLGFSGKYHVKWMVRSSNLFMSNLSFYTAELKPEHIKHIESATNRKFDKKFADKDPKTPVGEYGLMPATWLSDTIYVKKAKNFEEDIDEWIVKSYQQLIFRKGKLISKKEIPNKTWVVKRKYPR